MKAALTIAALVLTALWLYPEPDACQTYREMRAIYQDTQGRDGWPAYDAQREQECMK